MKLNNVENPEELLQVIDKCKGKVELLTAEGDRLNLKSKLCQIVALSNIFSSAYQIPELEIVAYEPEDMKLLLDYMMKG